MRYVILFFSLGCFLLWDGWFNGGVYLDHVLRNFLGLLSYVGL